MITPGDKLFLKSCAKIIGWATLGTIAACGAMVLIKKFAILFLFAMVVAGFMFVVPLLGGKK